MSRGGRFQFLDKLSSKDLLSEETNSTADFHVLILQYELSCHHQTDFITMMKKWD